MGSKSQQYSISPGNTTYLSISMKAQILGLRCDNGTFYIDIMQPDVPNDTISRQFYLTNGSWDNVTHECEKIRSCGSVVRTYNNCCSSCGHPTSGQNMQPTMHYLIEIIQDNPVSHVDGAITQALVDIGLELEKAKSLIQKQLNEVMKQLSEALQTIKQRKEAFEEQIIAAIEAKDL